LQRDRILNFCKQKQNVRKLYNTEPITLYKIDRDREFNRWFL